MPRPLPCLVVLKLFTFAVSILAHPGPHEHSHSRPEKAVERFLNGLDPEQGEALSHDLEDPERVNWHYVPRYRRGLPLDALSPEQISGHRRVLASLLSQDGVRRVEQVILLEKILGELTGNPGFRDPGKYYLSGFFKDPHTPTRGPWGWRVEGHHLSLNLLLDEDRLVAATPAFWGANPARVPAGEHEGLRVLAREEDLARTLARSLNPGQFAKALLSARAPRDILTGADREVSLQGFDGIRAGELNDDQAAQLLDLILVYLEPFRPAWRETVWSELKRQGWDALYFAWAGGLDPGEGHYYRIHGPTLLIEYDNTQNGANHIHAVVRDPRGDFGEDFLKEHYLDEDSHHHLH